MSRNHPSIPPECSDFLSWVLLFGTIVNCRNQAEIIWPVDPLALVCKVVAKQDHLGRFSQGSSSSSLASGLLETDCSFRDNLDLT